MELADEGSAIVFAFFCLLAGNVDGLTLNVRLLLPVALVWLRHSLMRILEAWGSGAMALLSPQSGPRSLVDCGPGITRPPVTWLGPSTQLDCSTALSLAVRVDQVCWMRVPWLLSLMAQ